MQEIKCPNCGEVFAVDESGYAQIAKQVRDKEFEKELKRRENDFAQMKENALKLAQMEQNEKFAKELLAKDAKLSEKDRLIGELRAQAAGNETEKKLAVSEVLNEKEKALSEKAAEIAELKSKLSNKETENELKEQSLQEN